MMFAFDFISIAASGVGLYYLARLHAENDFRAKNDFLITSGLLLIVATLALAASYMEMLK